MIFKEYLKDEYVKISQLSSRISDEQFYVLLIETDLQIEKLLQVLLLTLASLTPFFLGTNSRNRTLSHISNVNMNGSIVPLSDHIKLLCVTIDCNLNFRKHINLVSKSSFFHIKSLRHIRHALDADTARIIGHALTSSRLDYANSVLYGSPK